MSDPSIEAAQKVWERHEPPYRSDDLIATAREALRPIQEWFGKVMLEAVIEDLYEQLDLLESLHPLIFTTGELER